MKVGILGGGQLGLMLARAARDLGVEPLVLDPKPDAVAAQVARHLAVDWDDDAALDSLAECDVVTYEFENVPTSTVEKLAARVPVHPSPTALAISGDREREKNLFRELGIETARFVVVNSRADLDRAVAEIKLPAILKTRRFGYDGKGQAVLRSEADVEEAWVRLGKQELILEGFVPFEREVSVFAARASDGSMCYWPITENEHVDGILHISRAPAVDVSPVLFESAAKALESIMTKLDYVGVLVVEFFQLGETLIANEMACRVHNSAHWTIEGSATSQFENHLRAVAGLPLGKTDVSGYASMINLVGQIPELDALADDPDIHVHVYGKPAAPGRKLGHVTVTADSRDALEERTRRVLDVIGDRARHSRASHSP
jgi:5-(carboxyamino)imidazole ribonucleotide synthase